MEFNNDFIYHILSKINDDQYSSDSMTRLMSENTQYIQPDGYGGYKITKQGYQFLKDNQKKQYERRLKIIKEIFETGKVSKSTFFTKNDLIDLNIKINKGYYDIEYLKVKQDEYTKLLEDKSILNK